MNYESERRSLEDLKQQARQQSQAAGKVVPCVTVTEKNWAALLSLQQTQLQLLEQILKPRLPWLPSGRWSNSSRARRRS